MSLAPSSSVSGILLDQGQSPKYKGPRTKDQGLGHEAVRMLLVADGDAVELTWKRESAPGEISRTSPNPVSS